MKQRVLGVEPGRHGIPNVPRVQVMQQKLHSLLQGRGIGWGQLVEVVL
jgi:hypothetical protein